MAETIPFKSGKRPVTVPEEEGATNRESHEEGLQNRDYGSEEVSEIIRVALKNAGASKENQVNHAEMLSIGREFGLTEADLAQAHETIVHTREEEELSGEAMLSFRVHLMVFSVINLGLFVINMISSPTYWWFLYPLAGWGMAVGVHGIVVKYLPHLSVMLYREAVGLSKDFVDSKWGVQGTAPRAAFTIPNLVRGMAQAKGIAQIEGDALLLEYEITDKVIHAFKSKVKEVRIPISEIESVRLERRLVWTCLRLRGRRLLSFSEVPGAEGGEASLIFGRNARAESERLTRDLKQRIDR